MAMFESIISIASYGVVVQALFSAWAKTNLFVNQQSLRGVFCRSNLLNKQGIASSLRSSQ